MYAARLVWLPPRAPLSEAPPHRNAHVCATKPSNFPYQCPYCTGLFDDPDERAAHMRESHPDKPAC